METFKPTVFKNLKEAATAYDSLRSEIDKLQINQQATDQTIKDIYDKLASSKKHRLHTG